MYVGDEGMGGKADGEGRGGVGVVVCDMMATVIGNDISSDGDCTTADCCRAMPVVVVNCQSRYRPSKVVRRYRVFLFTWFGGSATEKNGYTARKDTRYEAGIAVLHCFYPQERCDVIGIKQGRKCALGE